MIKKIILLIFIAIACNNCKAQIFGGTPSHLDSLKHELLIAKDDTSRVLILADIANGYFPNFDSINFYGKEGLALAEKIKFLRGKVQCLTAIGFGLMVPSDFPKSLDYLYKALEIAEEKNYALEIALALNWIGSVYWYLPDYDKAVSVYKRAEQIIETIPNNPGAAEIKSLTHLNIGQAYNEMNQPDSAFKYLQKNYNETLYSPYWHPVALYNFGDCLFKQGNHAMAINYLHQSIALTAINSDPFTLAEACATISRFFREMKQRDSLVYYAKKGLASAQRIAYNRGILINSKMLAEEMEPLSIQEALFYRKIFDAANEELYGAKKVQELQKTLTEEQQRQREIEAEQIAYQGRIKQYAFLAALSIMLLITFILYRNNRQKQKANAVLETTLTNLKSTQAQLIQSEKMASLGELTAGIAHEIQNPLNFVNNFSEVNKELLAEMNDEIDKGNTAEVKAIAKDVMENEEKILHHGKRADAIVKGMLQHSSSSSGVKEPTNINALADEYLRLAYHGLRAKDKSFNATMKTDFDESIGNINIIPQDIGRVILNLITNAFYVVDEKKKQNLTGYEPLVTVSTKALTPPSGGRGVEIKVTDNGNGIPKNILDKIFQPFFTTKPTGQGTGLGLSLSYDIIKAQGGELKVETKESEGSQFIIILPA